MSFRFALSIALLAVASQASIRAVEEPLNISGVYPHLRMWNDEGECGTGAVVLWQGDLWAITYAPHKPAGSSDKLYQISPSLDQTIFKGSVGGTPANRMIHKPSDQLLIGPYLIDSKKNIRTIPPSKMYGRLTGIAAHLTDPQNKVYYATMEEGLYEVDVNTLDVTCLIRDGNPAAPKSGVVSGLPGYHGKGLYSGQDRVVYANNGDRDPRVNVDPTVSSGALGQWFGDGDWQLVRRNQFTEVTGPGGIYSAENPNTDPIWSMGWDARSVLLALLENEEWHYYRLPKGSHSYDGAHGWNTEWPRIREIGEDDFLATMHGTFWKFPPTFSLENSAGIAPRSNYLKVIGDFCRWGDRVVLGCDDSAKAEFLNTRPFKAEGGAPAQSNSNLWFVTPDQFDAFGPALGRGSVWLREDVNADSPSDPFLFSGFDHRQLHLTHGADSAVTFTLEIDREGNDQWEKIEEIKVPAGGAISHLFDPAEKGAWIRIKTDSAASAVTAHFQYRNRDPRNSENAPLFSGIATPGKSSATTGVMRSLGYDKLGLVSAPGTDGKNSTYYEINAKMELVPVDNPKAASTLISAVRQPRNTYTVDAASVLLVEDGNRYRLPKNDLYLPAEAGDTPPSKTLTDYLDQSLTAGADVTVSSTHADYAPANVIDGKLGDDSRWISGEEGAGWVALDLGSEKTFRSLWLVTGWKNDPLYAAKNFDIQIRGEGGWETLPGGEVRGNAALTFELKFEAPVSARNLRIASTDTGFFRISEIALFENVPAISAESSSDFGPARVCREVATERDLLNIHGTFYELPARNAQGVAKIRPIATHNLAVHDFCSHNGLLLLTGIDSKSDSDHLFRSADGSAAVWAGVIDDLWKLGKPRGSGGPWNDTVVKAGEFSDPYLMTGYDKKSVEITSSAEATITLEVDIDGTGLWIPYKTFGLSAGGSVSQEFPEGFSAYWVRAASSADSTASVTFRYE